MQCPLVGFLEKLPLPINHGGGEPVKNSQRGDTTAKSKGDRREPTDSRERHLAPTRGSPARPPSDQDAGSRGPWGQERIRTFPS